MKRLFSLLCVFILLVGITSGCHTDNGGAISESSPLEEVESTAQEVESVVEELSDDYMLIQDVSVAGGCSQCFHSFILGPHD